MLATDTTELTGLRGRVIHAPVYGALEEWRDGLVVWDGRGRIVDVGAAAALLPSYPDAAIADVRPALVLPGLVDAHTHLPQYPAAGLGSGELLPWLHRYIFPLERRFRAAEADSLAPRFFRDLASNGTTTAGIYLAVWEDSADVCFQHAKASGMRVAMGKVMMDAETYSDTAPTRVIDRSLEETDRLCRKWHGQDAGRIRYAVSPRFAVACSEALMRGAAEIAAWYDCGIQTHLSENTDELRLIAERFPDALDYTDVYARCGLLGPRTVMGHAIHLSEREREALGVTGTRVAHCPTSNAFLGSGLMGLDLLRRAGVAVGLGSDVAGGPDLSMWRVMRSALETRNARAASAESVAPLAARHVFHLATLGGAQALGVPEISGSFAHGKEADILVADPTLVAPPETDVETMDADEVLSLCVWRGDDRMTKEVYVRGRKVYTHVAG